MIGEIIGQEISVNVPKNMKAQVIPQGNSYQATREGYNLFDYMNKLEPSGNHGIKIDKDLESGYVTFNGTPDGSYIPIVVDFACDDLLEDGESYTIWQENHVSSDFGGIYIQVRVTNKEDSSTYNVFSATSNQHFTVNKSKYSYRLGIQTGTLTDAGTFNNYKNRYMLYKGTDDKAFELYGASPSLDYPSEVEAVGDSGSTEIVTSNKNILDLGQRSANGITFNKNKIKILNPSNYLYANNANLLKDKRLMGKTITLTLIANGKVETNNLSFNIGTNKNAYRFQKYYTVGNYNNDIYTLTRTLQSDEVIGGILIYVDGNALPTCNLEINVQIEIADEATEFVENEVNTYTIPIQKPFYKIGDYADKFIKQNNKWYEQHFIKELILTGEENWLKGNNLYPSYHIIVSDTINELSGEEELGLCNYFKAYSSVWFVDIIGFDIINIYSSEFTFRINLGSGSEITTVEAWKAKVQELYNAGTPIKVYYVLATPKLIECTEEQTQILEQLNNLYLYEGINYLYSTDDPSPIFQFAYDKIVNDFKFYLSENGRLIFPKENISFLCSISESSIPSMPEALETSATIAGRDGDVPLSTTYGHMSFELVLYTEDNLTPEEKLKQEIFLNRFCNSIKNNTETFALELAQKFYKIKYNGLLNKENYPKFLKFTLPFKSSKSFAYDVKKNTAYGNNTFESNTIEPTGFECVIKGPAIKPIISLNDYSIEYNNTILDDESLIIDTNNSTAVLVNSEGTRVNAMRYYNHQFPKILNGENELKILSGIDNPENVSISWYDLTL